MATYRVDPENPHHVLYDLGDGNSIVLCRSLRFAKTIARDLNRAIEIEEFIRDHILNNDDIPVEIDAAAQDLLEKREDA